MRLLLITNVFPNPIQPTKGTFNAKMILSLRRLGHEVGVVSPISWVDEWQARRKRRRIGSRRQDSSEGYRVCFPRYYYTPKVLRRWYGRFMWMSVRRTVRTLVNGCVPDAFLAYWAHPDGAVALRAAREVGKPCVVMVGGSDVLLLAQEPARRKCILRVLKAADAVVAVSQDIRSKLCEFGLEPSKIQVIYRGVDMEQFSPGDKREARGRLGLPLERPVFLWVGRMVPVKGLKVLLDACSILRQEGVDYCLALVGSGPIEEELKAISRAKGLGDHVHFGGSTLHKDLPDWYRAADMTVLPSLSEGVPNVLLESMACGTPFVASRVGGIPEIASPGIDRLATPGNASELAEAIKRQLSETLPKNDRTFKPESCEAAAERLVEVIRTVIATNLREEGATGRPAASKLGNRTSAWSWRQIARRAMAACLPRSFWVTAGPSKPRLVWLTFDDGPDPEYTPELLNVLRANNVRATFFVIGEKAERHPELLRRIVEEGHSLGNHTYRHEPIDRLSAYDVLKEVQRTSDVLRQILGKAPCRFRPPHGKLSLLAIQKLWSSGQQIVLWNSDSKDYVATSEDEILDRFRKYPCEAGDIVLWHDNRRFAAAVMSKVIEETRARGLEFAAMDDPAFFQRRAAGSVK